MELVRVIERKKEKDRINFDMKIERKRKRERDRRLYTKIMERAGVYSI